MAAKKRINGCERANDDEDELSGKNPYNAEYRIYLYGDIETNEKRF